MSTVAPAVPEVDSHLHSPPESSKESPSLKHDASASDSELSDIEDPEEDIGIIEPESWADDGRVPVFKPTMEQFKSFPLYMKGVNPYGMKSGIVKVIPPAEWKDGLPRLDEAIKTIKVKEPIKQDIMGTSGTYRQANILHQRSYNLPQWRQLCEQSEHQPPAKRGERRLNQDKPPVPRAIPKNKPTPTPSTSTAGRKKPGRPFKSNKAKVTTDLVKDGSATPDRLPTPVSPSLKPEDDMESESIKQEPEEYEEAPVRGRMGGRQAPAISVSSRRKYNRKEAAARVDEAAFKDFRYELDEEFSAERCEELERAYWKTLTYAPPLYGADMPGSLFTDATTTWNLGKLENILDVMGTKIPGVNTAYLYLGMWKATFAWHLEDVDLYSINYLHFGAPKQWYSISQGDARRFEAAMKTIWPTDAKACDQFLRHKTFLISPSHLLQNFNIKVNKIVCHPGEFVITFPYGYHSGYNLGYNCAEAVNFGMESWLEYGRVAKKCDCSQAQDSVWIDVREIERKMRGEETEFEVTEDEEEDEEDEDENGTTDLPTPPRSNGDIKTQALKKKRKRPTADKGQPSNLKRVRLRLKAPAREPCILCPNDIPNEPLLITEDGAKVHRMCALYIPETSIESGDTEIVRDVKYIAKARLDLKCNYCRSKKGACFQCSQKKCIRAYHATCAAAAGVFVEQGEIPVFGEDGTEYKEHGIEFSCRFHRSKRDKNLQANDLSEVERIRKAGLELKIGETCQMQYYRADIFAGIVVENRTSEETLLVNILPRGERIEVEYKWLLIPSPADFRLVKPSANAIPMPKSFKAKESLNTSKRKVDDIPRAADPFVEGCTWAEFKNDAIARNPFQVKIDFAKENQLWYYLGKTSTEARAQFTEDVSKQRHNPKGHFLDTIPKPINTAPRQSYAASYPNINQNALNASKGAIRTPQSAVFRKDDKPYNYKPRIPNSNDAYRVDPQAYRSQQNFLHAANPGSAQGNQAPSLAFGTDPRWRPASTASTTQPTPTPPPILPGATVATYSNSKYTSYPPSGSASQQPGSQYQQVSQQTSTQVNQQAKAQPGQQQPRPIIPPQNQFQPHTQPQQQQPRPQPPAQSRAILAPPQPYRPGYTPPILQPPRQNPFQAARPSSSKTNPFAKYAYLQKEHNRSPLEYKSPYRPGGGFMNGYEGNLKRHLEQRMFKNRQGSWNEVTQSAPSYGSNGQKMYSPSQVSPTGYTHTSQSPSSGSHVVASSPQQSVLQPHQITKAAVEHGWEKKDTSQYHPAIRQEYTNSMYHNHEQSSRRAPSQYSSSSPQTPQGHMKYEVAQTQQYQYQHSQQAHNQQNYQSHQNSSVLQPPQQVYRAQNSPPLHSPQYFQPYQPHHYPANPPGTPTSALVAPGQAPMQYHQHQIPQQDRYAEAKPVYAHQQPFQKPSPQAPQVPAQYQPQPAAPVQTQPKSATSMYSESYTQVPTQIAASEPAHARDFPDVPADSTSIIEQMLANLKKARPVSSSSAA